MNNAWVCHLATPPEPFARVGAGRGDEHAGLESRRVATSRPKDLGMVLLAGDSRGLPHNPFNHPQNFAALRFEAATRTCHNLVVHRWHRSAHVVLEKWVREA